MFARMITFQILPDQFNKMIHLCQESLRPILDQQAGFNDIYILEDPVLHKIVSISLWRTKANMEAFDVHCQSLATQFMPLLQTVPMVEIFKVTHPSPVSSIEDVPYSMATLGIRIEED